MSDLTSEISGFDRTRAKSALIDLLGLGAEAKRLAQSTNIVYCLHAVTGAAR
jgi:hypothetical protein